MERVEAYRELKVYRAAFGLQQRVFEASRSFPKDERYSLTDQVRRSSRSVGANVAEAWKKRRYRSHFVSTLTDADAEAAETRHRLATANACGYLSDDAQADLEGRTREVDRTLGAMIRDADRWCTKH